MYTNLEPRTSQIARQAERSSSTLGQQAKKREFGRHETVYYAGDAATSLFEVVTGSLFIYKLLDDGRRQVVDLLGPGDICGFSMDGRHGATCETLEPTTLLSIDRAMLRTQPEAQERVLRRAEMRVAALQEHAIALGRKTATERIAELLVRLAAPGGCPQCGRDSARFVTALTRCEMADYLGLTLETVSRTLTCLERKGYIRIGESRGAIEVVDLQRLARAGKAETH